jgi:hypothetical protein
MVPLLQGRRGPRLAQKALLRRRALHQVRQHGFDGHLTPQLDILALEHHAHAAVAEDLEDAKTAEPAQLIVGLGRCQEIGQVGLMADRRRLLVARDVRQVRRRQGRRFRRRRRAAFDRGQRPHRLQGRRWHGRDRAAAGTLHLLADQLGLDRELPVARRAGKNDHGVSLVLGTGGGMHGLLWLHSRGDRKEVESCFAAPVRYACRRFCQ